MNINSGEVFHLFVFFFRWKVRDLSKMQTALQKMSLRQMPGNRDGPEVGPEQRRETNPIQELLQEEGRESSTAFCFDFRRQGNNISNNNNNEETEISRPTSLSKLEGNKSANRT